MKSLAAALLLVACAPEPARQRASAAPHPGVSGPGAAMGEASVSVETAARPRRVLLVIADDLGVESLGVYADRDGDGHADDGRSYASTPTIDGLCNDGLRFTEAWAHPTCSPSRASMLTGRLGARTGIGHAIARGEPGLDSAEPTLPRWLGAHPELGVATALVGKWHLGATDAVGGDDAPGFFGWDHFSGLLEDSVGDYFWWPRTHDGETAFSDVYATTAHVDDALGWLDDRQQDESWLLWVSLTAPHEPLHAPPSHLHSQGPLAADSSSVREDPLTYFQASVEASDSELARLLAGLDARGMSDVDVIFVGDNGSSGRVVQAPWAAGQAKETLFEGGVHVPLCVAGPSVAQPGRISPALVHVVDLYATTGALFGLDPVADLPDSHRFDSISFLPVLASADAAGDRVFATTDGFGGNNDNGQGEAIRDARFKLVRWADGSESAFDLEQDPHETDDLLVNEDHGSESDMRSADHEVDGDAVEETELVSRLDALSAQLDAYRSDTGR